MGIFFLRDFPGNSSECLANQRETLILLSYNSDWEGLKASSTPSGKLQMPMCEVKPSSQCTPTLSSCSESWSGRKGEARMQVSLSHFQGHSSPHSGHQRNTELCWLCLLKLLRTLMGLPQPGDADEICGLHYAKALAPSIMPSFLKYFLHLASESHYSADFPPLSQAASSKSSPMDSTFLLNLYDLKLPKVKSWGHFSSPSSPRPWWSSSAQWL